MTKTFIFVVRSIARAHDSVQPDRCARPHHQSITHHVKELWRR